MFSARLRAGQPAGRPLLHVARSADPLLTWRRALAVPRTPWRVADRGGASRMRSGAIRPRSSAALVLLLMIADRDLRALARHGRSAGALAGPAPASRRRPSTGSAPTCSAATSTAASSTARASRSSSGCRVAAAQHARSAWRSASSPASCRWLDAIVMRIMDGLMSIPPVLLAIALMALTKASIENVIVAITLAEVPRVVRLVRSLVLTLARAALRRGGDRGRHELAAHPAAAHPAQHGGAAARAGDLHLRLGDDHRGDPVASSAPARRRTSRAGATSWPRARSLFQIAGYLILFPGIFLSLTVLAVNLLGDGLRDALDPRLARQHVSVTRCADAAAARGRRPQDPLLHARRRRARGRRRLVLGRARRDAGDRRRVRLRQERHRAVDPAPDRRRRRAASSPARSASRAATCSTLSRARDARDPRQRDLDDLPGADDLAQPGADRRPADRRDAELHQRPRPRARRCARAVEMLQLVQHPGARAARRRSIRTSSPAACASA